LLRLGVAGLRGCGYASPAAIAADPVPVLIPVGIGIWVILLFLLREELGEVG
jgi:hypothetical protein